MADTILHRYQNGTYTWSGYDTNKIIAKGELRFFENVITGQINYGLMVGNGSSKVSELPFDNMIEIYTSNNVDLEDLRITNNRVSIFNNSGSTITVQIGITGSLEYINLLTKEIIYLYFDGSNWTNINHHCANINEIGDLYLLPEASRSSSWILAAGNDLSWTDVDFSSYVETGDRLTAVYLHCWLRFDGDASSNIGVAFARKNGSSETNGIRTRLGRVDWTTLAAGKTMGAGFFAVVLCDENGVIEYQIDDAQTYLNLTIMGYYLKGKI